jgi:glycine/D-amino acid oxidase-like deaminating enzyme
MTVKSHSERSLSDANPIPFWTDSPLAPTELPKLQADTSTDLLIVGGGLTGLWAAIEAKRINPSQDVLLLESERIAFGASGRNGGFFSESLTHGLSHGLATWPDEIATLLRLGRENVSEIFGFLNAEGVDADLRLCGKSTMATRNHHIEELAQSFVELLAHGESAENRDQSQTQADIYSPTFLGSLRSYSGGGLLDPAKLVWGLRDVALRYGVRIHENTKVIGLSNESKRISVRTEFAKVHAGKVILATNAFDPLLKRMRNKIIPLFDHVLVSDQLNQNQIDSLGWKENQGVTDSGNQFHYYRRTPDNRILWGGYDALYYFGSSRTAGVKEHAGSHALLARQFFETFPQLEEVRFTHKWAGMIDATSRFTPAFGTAMSGKLAYAYGYTGLGVASSRFGARVALDLLDKRKSELTELTLVKRQPISFPPEPLRYALVQATRAELEKEDISGNHGLWLRFLDRLGVGFNS